jgi:hypothetical protein
MVTGRLPAPRRVTAAVVLAVLAAWCLSACAGPEPPQPARSQADVEGSIFPADVVPFPRAERQDYPGNPDLRFACLESVGRERSVLSTAVGVWTAGDQVTVVDQYVVRLDGPVDLDALRGQPDPLACPQYAETAGQSLTLYVVGPVELDSAAGLQSAGFCETVAVGLKSLGRCTMVTSSDGVVCKVRTWSPTVDAGVVPAGFCSSCAVAVRFSTHQS